MFCPNCHYEYVLGVSTCPDCGVTLVAALPPRQPKAPQEPEHPLGFEILYRTNNLPNIAVAKSLLEDAGIEYISRDDWVGGFSRITLLVSSGDLEQARALLADLEPSGHEEK